MTQVDSRFRRPLGLIALTTLALTLAACDNKNEANTAGSGTTATESSGGTGSTTSGGNRDVLVVQESADIPTLDPGTTYDTSSGQVVENLYETLVYQALVD